VSCWTPRIFAWMLKLLFQGAVSWQRQKNAKLCPWNGTLLGTSCIAWHYFATFKSTQINSSNTEPISFIIFDTQHRACSN